jgi:hydrogenase expression/formation protein HypE
MTSLPVGKLPADLLHALLEGVSVDEDVIVGPGIGRDAAAVRVGDQILVFKSDPITFPTDDAGWYLVNINANDIACMGASPRWLLVTALLPEGRTSPELVKSLFSSIQSACTEIGCSLIGGHTEITEGLDRPILAGQMIGIAEEESLIDPRGAQSGDAVMLAGGIAIEGTAILASELLQTSETSLAHSLLTRASEFDRTPGISIQRYARRLSESAGLSVQAMHDPTEGGLATGLREIAEATGLGVEIVAEQVSIYPETRAITEVLGLDPWGLIASGALLFVVPDNQVDVAHQTLSGLDVPVGQIGRLTSDSSERTLLIDGTRDEIPEFTVDEIARYFANR